MTASYHERLERMPPLAARIREIGHRFRRRRFALVRQVVDRIIEEKGFCSVIDLGGAEPFWRMDPGFLDSRRGKMHVDLVNLHPDVETDDPELIAYAIGDATALTHIADDAYDLALSNSVIEHVGDFSKMRAMAGEVRRVAPRYLIQTPYYWFPIEPHFQTPLIHWLPRPWRIWLLMNSPLGFHRPATIEETMGILDRNVLLTRTQMRALFPDADRIVNERVGPLTKSITALKTEARPKAEALPRAEAGRSKTAAPAGA